MGAALFCRVAQPRRLLRPAEPLLVQAAALALLIGGGALVYLAAAQLTGAADIRQLLRAMRRAATARAG